VAMELNFSKKRKEVSMSVKENNKGKRIVGFRLLGKYHSVDTWKELLITVSVPPP